VPADAVRDAGASSWALIANGGRAERRAVKLGLRGDGRVEILEGIVPGDRVIPAVNLTVKPGDRIRVRAPAKVK